MSDEKYFLIYAIHASINILIKNDHFVSKISFPENWILIAEVIVSFFCTRDGVVHVGNFLVIFLHKELNKSGSLSMSEGRMHVTTVETRMDGTREGIKIW